MGYLARNAMDKIIFKNLTAVRQNKLMYKNVYLLYKSWLCILQMILQNTTFFPQCVLLEMYPGMWEFALDTSIMTMD